MKNTTLFLGLVLLIFVSCENNNIKNSLTDYDLIGNVKKIKELEYSAIDKFGKVNKGKRERQVWYEDDFIAYFNPEGFLTKKVFIDNEDNIYRTLTMSYDKMNRVVLELYQNPDETIFDKWEKVYENNILKESNRYKNDTLNGRWIHLFENEKIIKDTWYGPDGNPTETWDYKYSSNNLIKESIKFSQEGNVVEVHETHYNKKGKKVYEKMLNSENEIISEREYKYDDNGLLIEEIRNNSLNDDYEVFILKYKFDSYNNWIEREVSINNLAKFITTREIEYY